MTTTITLKTDSWPVDVTTTDQFARTLTTSVETVAPNTTRDFYITSTRSIAFTELPVRTPTPATSDDQPALAG